MSISYKITSLSQLKLKLHFAKSFSAFIRTEGCKDEETGRCTLITTHGFAFIYGEKCNLRLTHDEFCICDRDFEQVLTLVRVEPDHWERAIQALNEVTPAYNIWNKLRGKETVSDWCWPVVGAISCSPVVYQKNPYNHGKVDLELEVSQEICNFLPNSILGRTHWLKCGLVPFSSSTLITSQIYELPGYNGFNVVLSPGKSIIKAVSQETANMVVDALTVLKQNYIESLHVKEKEEKSGWTEI